jgi:competence protein ComEC
MLILRRVGSLCAARDVRPFALSIALLCTVFYALLAGWGIPVRRALVLLLGVAAALVGGRSGSGGHALAVAALAIAVVEPWAIFEPGAQLSFAASAGLLYAARQVGEGDASSGPGAPSASAWGRRPSWRAVGLAWRAVVLTSATAFAATAPIAVAHGGVASPLALASNALLVPWTGLVLLPLSLAAAAVAALPESGLASDALGVAAHVAGWTLSTLVWAAQFAPRAGPASPPASWALLLAAGLALFTLSRRTLWARAALAMILALWLRAAPPASIEPLPPRLVALDVGLGDAILIQGERAAVLVDGGWASPGRADLGATVVVPALRALGVASLDLVVATHGDTDHQGGLRAVLREFPVSQLWLPPGGSLDPVFADLVAQARRRGVRIEERSGADAGVDLGDLHIVPLWPPSALRGSANDRSLVLRIDAAGLRVLLTGDLGGDAERALLDSGADLRSDVVKVGHHGSRASTSADFLQRVDARIALVSAPCGRRALPSGETLERLRAAGEAVWWTGRDGALFVGLGPEPVVWGWAERAKVGCTP